MPISRDGMRNLLQLIVFDFEGTTDTLKIWFAPNLITPEFQRMVKRSSAQMVVARTKWEHRRADALAALGPDEDLPADLLDDSTLDRDEQRHQLTLLTTVIKRWDYLEYDPTPENPNPPEMPINFETLEGLGWPLLNRIGREIAAANEVDPTRSRRTSGGSEVSMTAGRSRNGAF